ncbi:MAG: phage tail tube protein, partial [Brevundimonas sp.]
MPLNFGYIGIGKETTAGTAVAPSAFFRATSPAQMSARVEFYEIPGIDAFGPVGVVPTQLSGEGDIEVVVQPRSIGHLLAGLLGLPNTSGGTAPYTHTFTPKNSAPTYTLEAQDGVAVHRLVGSRVSSLEFTHSADGVLLARASLVSMNRTTTGTPATGTYEADLFTVGQVTVSVGGTALQGRTTAVSVSLQFPKTPRHTVESV